MHELIKALNAGETVTSVVTIWAVLLGGGLSALLSIGIGVLYRKTHADAGYSQDLVHTFVMMSLITALIMLIIGSNIARAFSLVGALSIIRFRTAIKSPRDVAFVFFAISIGMACGTGFYAVATVGFLLISAVLWGLYYSNFGASPETREHLLSILFNMDADFEKLLEPVFKELFEAYHVAYVETVKQGTLREVVYSVRPSPKTADKEVVDAVRKVNDNLKITYRSVRHAVEIP